MGNKRRGNMMQSEVHSGTEQSSRSQQAQKNSQLLLIPQHGGGQAFWCQSWVSSRKDKETSVTVQVVSFMIFSGTQPTTARGLFTKVILQHRPQKHLWRSLPKLTWESNRRNWTQPCKTCPSHFISSVSPQMAAVGAMTAYKKQSPQEWIQPLGWK